MILDYLLLHRDHLRRETTREALDHHEALIEKEGAPLDVDAPQLHAFVTSRLLEELLDTDGRSIEGVAISRLERIREPNPAEYARLISKGRILYEHCMTEVSHACVIGFMHHELRKSRASERVILDLLGWMIQQRLELEELADSEGDEAARRCAHTDYMIDQGVSFLHGLSREQAVTLADEKEPLD